MNLNPQFCTVKIKQAVRMTTKIISNEDRVEEMAMKVYLKLILNAHSKTEIPTHLNSRSNENSLDQDEFSYPPLTSHYRKQNLFKSTYPKSKADDTEGLIGSARKFFGLTSKIV
jgi:hypothetical protein